MARAVDIHLYVEQEENGERLRVVSPTGVPKLNARGVELANILRGAGDPEFHFAEPVAVVGLEQGKYLIQVGPHTELWIDPEYDDYFL